MQIGWWGRREKSHSKINPCILSCFGTITQESEESEKLEGIQVKSTRMEGTLKFMRKERLGWLALFNQERTMGRGSGSFLFTDWWKEVGEKETSPSGRCTVKGQAEAIVTCVGGYSSWTEENCFNFRGVQCWNKTPERVGIVQPWWFPNLDEWDPRKSDLPPELDLLWPWCWIRHLKVCKGMSWTQWS